MVGVWDFLVGEGVNSFSMLSLPAVHQSVLYFYFQDVSRIRLHLHLSPATRSEPLSSHMWISASFLTGFQSYYPHTLPIPHGTARMELLECKVRPCSLSAQSSAMASISLTAKAWVFALAHRALAPTSLTSSPYCLSLLILLQPYCLPSPPTDHIHQVSEPLQQF